MLKLPKPRAREDRQIAQEEKALEEACEREARQEEAAKVRE